MEYYTIFGMVVVALIAMVGVYYAVKTNTEKSMQVIHELNLSITKLTAAIENMQKEAQVTNKRLEKHGKEIDELKDKVIEAEHILSNHEARLVSNRKEIDKLQSYHTYKK